jgi:hypothetical protein
MEVIKAAIESQKGKKKNFLINYIENKLSKINLSYSHRNTKKAIQITIEMCVLGILYFIFSSQFFKGIWYLYVLIIISTISFMLTYLDVRLELIKKKVKSDIPKTTRKIRHYLVLTKNISKALGFAAQKSPETTVDYVQKMKVAVDSKDPKLALEELKKSSSEEWVKLECSLINYCKINGDKDKTISKSLNKVTNIIDFVNIQQGLDNAEILWAQIFTFLLPILGIPGIQYMNDFMFKSLDQANLYLDNRANVIAAQILLISNILTLFISWIRKNN